MINFKEAAELIFKNIPPSKIDIIDIENAVGHILAEDVISKINVSPFRNSAMDGYAVKAQWLDGASEENEITLPTTTTIFAGDSPENSNVNKIVTKIMTGAPVPDLYDAVVKVEDVNYSKDEIEFSKPTTVGANIRPAGEDVSIGESIFYKGQRLTRLDIGPLASIGLSTVKIIKKPDLLIAVTGDELVKPGEELTPGKIYNSNEYTIRSLVQPLSNSLTCTNPIHDDRVSLKKILQNKHDLIITSGGVSAGDKDLVISTAEAVGWETIFHKVQIKPGKPFYFAKRGNQLLVGLPGNPLSTAITCCIFVIPLLKKMAGRHDYLLKTVNAKMDESSYRVSGRLLIWPAKIVLRGEIPKIELSDKRSSASLTALTNSDGLAIQSAWGVKDNKMPDLSFIGWNELLD